MTGDESTLNAPTAVQSPGEEHATDVYTACGDESCTPRAKTGTRALVHAPLANVTEIGSMEAVVSTKLPTAVQSLGPAHETDWRTLSGVAYWV